MASKPSKGPGNMPNMSYGMGKTPAAGPLPPKGQKSAGGTNHEAEHGGNGLIKAMHASADKTHPC